MEFKSLTNIETSFRQIRLFALVFICLCALVTGFAVWNSYSFAEKQRQKIYVLDNGKSLMLALSQDMAQNRPVEAKSHVRRFHELFFTLSPDKGAIESNIKRSLFLADKTAFNYYKDLAEKGYYNRVISGNVTQTVEIDSVKCDFDQYPYKVNTYARQLIVRESSLTVRSLVTSCRLLNATERQQPARLHHRSVHHYREQGFTNRQEIALWRENEITSKRCRTGRTTDCAECADGLRRAKGWRLSS